jgi:hypothetical protein
MSKGYFGPAIIGDAAYEAEKEYVLEHKGIFGPAVLDPHASQVAEAQQLAVEGSHNEPGPAVADADTETEPAEDAYMVSVKDGKKILAANPLEVDNFFRAELARPDGPRKSMLNALIDAENDRPGAQGDKTPRPEVIDALGHALASLEG